MNGMPVVRIDDILIHPRDNDLIVGTHGRSIYILDDITPLQQLNDKVRAADVHLFDVRPGVALATDVTLTQSVGGAKTFRGENPLAGTAVSYYLKAAPQGDVKIAISDYTGRVVRTLDGTRNVGLNRVQWNLRATPPARPAGAGGFGGGGGGFGGTFAGVPLDPGAYVVRLSAGGKDYTSKLIIEADDFGK
jgi:hypothetical protein